MGRGNDIYEKYVKTAIVERDQIACFYAITALLSGSTEPTSLYTYSIRCDRCRSERADNLGLMTGSVTFRSDITHEESHLCIASIWLGNLIYIGGAGLFVSEDVFAQMEQELWETFNRKDIHGLIRNLKKYCDTIIPFRQIFPDGRKRIQATILATTLADLESHLCQDFSGIALVQSMRKEGTTPPVVLNSLEQYILNAEVRRCLEAGTGGVPALRRAITRLIQSKATPDSQMLSSSAAIRISRDVKSIVLEPMALQMIHDLNSLLRALKPLSLQLDLRESQNLYFSFHARCINQAQNSADGGDTISLKWLDEIQELGRHLDVIYGIPSCIEKKSLS